MHVLVLNESTKKALIRSRRVLSKFLPQLGSSTWSGAISEEGLEDLKAALKTAGVSKNTAVSCLKLEGRGRLTLQWIVGSAAAFDENGRFAFRQTAYRAPVEPPAPLSTEFRLALALLRLSGLSHDTGKASNAFAQKLLRGSGAEAIRHELLSFLLIAESLWTNNVTDEIWLQQLCDDPASLVRCVRVAEQGQLLSADSPWLARVLDALASASTSPEDTAPGEPKEAQGKAEVRQPLVLASEIDDLFSRAPALSSMLWLVLTHHRLPNSDRTGQAWWAKEHVNVPKESLGVFVADAQSCLRVADGTPPWEDAGWKEAVRSAAQMALAALQELRAQGGLKDKQHWALFNAHYMRPTLILADHLGSMRAAKSFRKTDKAARAHIFANTQGDHYGDTLTVHELAVARLTRKITHLFNATWPTAELPAHSLSVVRSLKAPYDWQLHLEDACIQARKEGPVFATVVAETGAGKTLGGLRAANALSGGKLRVTLALGLRSLTQQSAQSMLKDADLPAKDLVVAVGQPQTLALAGKYRAQESLRFGSDSAEGAEEDTSLVQHAPPELGWLDGFCTQKEAQELWGTKSLAMLSAPVLACTTDHLVRSATMLRGGDAKMYLRLASSDLLLDEIDAYSARDLQSVAKLAFIAGLHGRNVTVMSATLSPAVQQGLYAAWLQGLQTRESVQGGSSQHACVFSSNALASEVHPSKEALCPSHWTRYVEGVAQLYAAQAPKRKATVVPVDLGGTLEDAFEASVQAACRLHEKHHTVEPLTQKRVSVGFVRLSTAKNAWKLAHYLSTREQGNGADIRFVAYHSKFPRSYLGVLDVTLGALTKRKDPDAFLSVPALRQALESSTKEDVLVLVCTTTLMETGRDFDFDWCVMEPRSMRGEIQAVGRVRRHRGPSLETHPNVALLSHSLRALQLTTNTPAKVWSRPGVEDELPGLRVTLALPTLLAPQPGAAPAPARAMSNFRPKASSVSGYALGAQEALPLSQWQRGMNAGMCLTPVADYASNRIGYLEQCTQALNLTGARTWDSNQGGLPPSMNMYLHSWACLNQAHARATPFRGLQQEQLTFVPFDGQVTYVDEQARAARQPVRRRSALGALWLEVPPTQALLPDLEQRAQTLYTGKDPHIDGCALRCPWHLGSEKLLSWSPLLGFCEE